jgi:hypothetical protein
MYRVFLALFLILTIFSSFAAKKSDPKARADHRDEVVRGESSVERRAQAMPGNHRDLNKGPGVTTGTNCTTTDGSVVSPGSMLYKKCVDTANRIK